MKEDEQRWGRTSLLAHENDRIKKNLLLRDRLMRVLRSYLNASGFVEVDTPILRCCEDPTDNPPFVTLGPLGWPRLHLRTCPEEYTRRCACAFGKAFEIGKCFRNERIRGHSSCQLFHLPEFTMAEIYEVDADLEDSLVRMENTVMSVVQELQNTTDIPYQRKMLKFAVPFQRLKVLDALDNYGDSSAKAFVTRHKAAEPVLIPGEDHVLHEMLDTHVKPKIFQPTFLTHFPKSADQLPDRSVGNEIHRAEFVAAHIEIGEVGALQPDAGILHQHVTAAVTDRHGYLSADHLVDMDYLAEVGAFNRPVGGGAIGIDRLLMLLCDTIDMRDVVWYPSVGKYYEGGKS